MLKIQVGEILMDKIKQGATSIVSNKTRKYLLPCLKEYGETFMYKINNVYKIAAGIGDMIITNRGIKYERHIFILCDSSIATKQFSEFLDWVREQSMYEDDYIYNNIQKSTSHMVILRFPEKFYDSFETFHHGKYSKMFSADTIKQFFESYPDVKKVLIKDKNYRIVFTKKLNKDFGTTIKPEEWEGELDYPPSEVEEIFNNHLKNKE